MKKTLAIAVCGAHMIGMPLNYQLTELGSQLRGETYTSANYRMFELANQLVSKPGMIRDETNENSTSIIVEVWDMPIEKVGYFLAQIKVPLGLAEIELENGEWVHAFVCDRSEALKGTEISHYKGWRHFKTATKI